MLFSDSRAVPINAQTESTLETGDFFYHGDRGSFQIICLINGKFGREPHPDSIHISPLSLATMSLEIWILWISEVVYLCNTILAFKWSRNQTISVWCCSKTLVKQSRVLKLDTSMVLVSATNRGKIRCQYRLNKSRGAKFPHLVGDVPTV